MNRGDGGRFPMFFTGFAFFRELGGVGICSRECVDRLALWTVSNGSLLCRCRGEAGLRRRGVF